MTASRSSFKPSTPTARPATPLLPLPPLVRSGVAEVGDGIVAPKADGNGSLKVAYEGLEAEVPVVVRRASAVEPLRFRNDVMPVLTKAGCNTGKCHGAASGKDGFRLSLFGYDPEGDHFRIIREVVGRRVNLAAPEDSLLITKSIGKVAHTGGMRIEPGSEGYQIILSWLEAGAPSDPADAPQPLGIEVFPRLAVFASPAEAQRLVVRARYSDGSDRDVTRFTVFISNNDAAVTVDDQGVAAGKGPGEAFILARFDQFTSGVPIIVRPGTPFESPRTPTFNWIDTLCPRQARPTPCPAVRGLRRRDVPPPSLSRRDRPVADPRGADGLRERPQPQETRGIDRRLAARRDEFLDIWTMKWAELLQIRTANGLSPKGLQRYDAWLRDRVRSGVTIDKIALELLPATGGSFENPAVNYYQTETTPQIVAENVAQVFLGTRIQCAQCHNHPFDRWTMDDYYGFASFFSRIGYKQAQDPRELTVYDAGSGEIKHPIAGREVTTYLPRCRTPEIKSGEDCRKTLAGWLASPENPAFARNLANIVWAHFFGQGIIDPVDDARVSNPPSNPELLDALARRLVEVRYDIKPVIRDILQSRTYQLTTQRNESNRWDERNFSHQKVRRMRARFCSTVSQRSPRPQTGSQVCSATAAPSRSPAAVCKITS